LSYSGEVSEAGPLEYIWNNISEAGLLTSWTEIKAWSELTGNYLETWEAALIWKISNAYLNQFQKSADMLCPCPIEKAQDKKDISEGLKKTMLGLNK